MAQDQSGRLVTDDELEDAREAIREQHEQIRQDLEAEGVDVSGWTARDTDGDGDAED